MRIILLKLFRNGSCPYTIWFMKNDNDVIINNYNETQIEELLSHLSEKCGIPINIEAMFDLYDLFKSMISNELQLPEWINHEQFQLMELIYYEQTRRVYNNKKIQNIIIGPLIKQISLNMELQSNSPDYIKTKNNMHLYAGHDMTLGTMMYFLGNNKIKLPDFGASAHFHLYLNKTIKVFYYNKWDNENGEEMSIPKCGYSCNLDDFVNLINNEMSTEWEQDCQIEGN
uniref:acid phosphatase n=1 Tax=Sipha flava TaxID=143950 RepID=A0A2S2QIM0_9HEMI